METITTADVFETLSAAHRTGKSRRTLRPAIDSLLDGFRTAIDQQQDLVLDSLDNDAETQRAAWQTILTTTTTLARAHEAIAELGSLERRATQLLGATVAACEAIVDLASIAPPQELIPADLLDALDELRSKSADPKAIAEAMLAAGQSGVDESMLAVLAFGNRLRVRAMHARVLAEIAATVPDMGAATEQDRDTAAEEALDHAHQLRAAALGAAQRLRGGLATPEFAMLLWSALFEAEQWVDNHGASRVAGLSAAATARVTSDDANAAAWAREAGKTYDAIRQLLAFDAGVRTVLLAYAGHDLRSLSAFERTRALALGSAAVDLPRSALGEVASADEEAPIEIDGIVRDAHFVIGGPRPRSVLELGTDRTGVHVLVPFVATDSFGVTKDVWIQVRGEAHPTGKDDLEGPTVMVGRIREADAADLSFTDALIHTGRENFQIRPGGLDIVAGRLAGDASPLNEIGLRR